MAQDFVSDEVIVQYNHSYDNYSLLSVDPINNVAIISLSGETVENAIQRLSADPTVAFVQPNYLYEFSSLPNDPYFANMR